MQKTSTSTSTPATAAPHDHAPARREHARDYGAATLEYAVGDDLVVSGVVYDRELWQSDGEGGVQPRVRLATDAYDEGATCHRNARQMIDVDAARETAEQARKTYEDAASQYAVRLSQVAALLVRAQKPTAALLVFDQDEETVSADTTIEIVSVRDADETDLGELDCSTSHEVCGLICTAYDSAAGFYPVASQDTYDTESIGGQWQDRNLLELHIDILLTDRTRN